MGVAPLGKVTKSGLPLGFLEKKAKLKKTLGNKQRKMSCAEGAQKMDLGWVSKGEKHRFWSKISAPVGAKINTNKLEIVDWLVSKLTS